MIKDLKVGDKVLFHGMAQNHMCDLCPIFHSATATVASYDVPNDNVELKDIQYDGFYYPKEGWVHLIQIEKVLE